MPIFLPLWALAHAALALGYCAAGLWPWTLLVLASAVAWLAARRRGAGACLCLTAAAAAAGIILSASAAAMIVGASASLAAWDFSTAGLPEPRDAAAASELRRYARARMPIALGAIGVGAALAALGSQTRLRLPFWAVFACVAVLVLALDRAARFARKRAR
jgi:hypothetical protein